MFSSYLCAVFSLIEHFGRLYLLTNQVSEFRGRLRCGFGLFFNKVKTFLVRCFIVWAIGFLSRSRNKVLFLINHKTCKAFEAHVYLSLNELYTRPAGMLPDDRCIRQYQQYCCLDQHRFVLPSGGSLSSGQCSRSSLDGASCRLVLSDILCWTPFDYLGWWMPSPSCGGIHPLRDIPAFRLVPWSVWPWSQTDRSVVSDIV